MVIALLVVTNQITQYYIHKGSYGKIWEKDSLREITLEYFTFFKKYTQQNKEEEVF